MLSICLAVASGKLVGNNTIQQLVTPDVSLDETITALLTIYYITNYEGNSIISCIGRKKKKKTLKQKNLDN